MAIVTATCFQCKNLFTGDRKRHQINSGRLFCGLECYYESNRSSWENRFWEKVNKDGPTPNIPDWSLGQCWIWTASSKKDGYGHFGITREMGQPKIELAHRVSWLICVGEIPFDLLVCHACDNPSCVRPDHLWLGTYPENKEDARIKGRLKTSKIKLGGLCLNGHELTPENTIVEKNGILRCRICRSKRKRDARLAIKNKRIALTQPT